LPTLTDEVERRLGEIFEEKTPTSAIEEDSAHLEDTPLKDLKATVLSIDWEITDETMAGLLKEIGRLKDVFKDDQILVLFLKLLESVGKYIKVSKAGAHPDAVKLFNWVYNSFEKVAVSEGMPEAERKEILFGEIDRFKKVKEQIVVRRADAAKKKPAPAPKAQKPKPVVREAAAPDVSRVPPHEVFANALEEIKGVINAEFRALRAELKLWMKDR
jgi:hypothetical protein